MLYNFYLRKFYEKRIIKKKLAGLWIPVSNYDPSLNNQVLRNARYSIVLVSNYDPSLNNKVLNARYSIVLVSNYDPSLNNKVLNARYSIVSVSNYGPSLNNTVPNTIIRSQKRRTNKFIRIWLVHQNRYIYSIHLQGVEKIIYQLNT